MFLLSDFSVSCGFQRKVDVDPLHYRLMVVDQLAKIPCPNFLFWTYQEREKEVGRIGRINACAVISDLGISPMAGHLFLLYFAVMSALTPPVAVAAYAASAIADENPLTIAVTAVRIAIAAFLVPFSFVFNHALLLEGTVSEIVFATISACLGLFVIAMAIEGYYRKDINGFSRALLAAAGILFLYIDPLFFGIAIVLSGATLWSQFGVHKE